MTAAQSGYLLLADISGYTAFLSDSELEHARDTLTDLLGLLIDHAKTPLVLSKLEGDAVFSYTWGEECFKDGQTLVELIEATYVAFRRAIELMVMNNTCKCAACANVSKLDLKFFVHHGSFAKQELGGQAELVGTEVTLVHRLMKNNVSEETGITAYSLYTDAAIKRLGIEDIAATMIPHIEHYDHLDDVTLWVEDMHPIWEQRRAEHRIDLDVLVRVDGDIGLPPEVVWGYLSQPNYRSVINGVERVSVEKRQAGRIGPESQFQCFHGKNVLNQVIVEWTPFERIVTQDTETSPLMNKLTWKNEYQLVPTESGGTHLSISLGDFEGSRFLRKFAGLVLPRGAKQVEGNLQEFAALVEADWAKQRANDGESAPVVLTPDSIRTAANSSLRNP